MGLVDFIHQGIDGVHVDQAHKVEPETVDMVLVGPVFDAVHDVLAYHAPLGGGVVAAAGAVGIGAVGFDPAEVIGDDLVEAEILGFVHVVVDHVHDHADAVVVEALDHLLHFFDTDFTVVGVGGIGAFGNVEVHGIISPVELGVFPIFIRPAVVENGQQMQMGNAHGLDVIQTRGNAALGSGAGLDQP